MKSVFNKIEKEKSKEIEFPVLAEIISSYDKPFVVLFTDERSGVVVKNNYYNKLGDYCDYYISVYDTTIWRILSPEESIVLSKD